MHDDPTAAFASLVARAGDELPLDEAALLIAAHARPGLDVAAEQAALDDLAAGVADPSLTGVCAHLVELGFAGDRETYHDPDNSLLPAVLARRRGIPLTLAVVAMEIGRRVGVPILGVGMPGHFLIRSADDERTFVDLFHGGRELDVEGCRAVFERLSTGLAWSEAHLRPTPPVPIVARLLANLANAYRRNGDRRALCWAFALRTLLPGVTAQERREMAVVLGSAGRYTEAAAVLEASGQERDAVSAQRLRARLN
ncbi:MAG TPA: transglutaminase-like domain-containing protein [Acidimicrobiales bacterium]|nr:transglutaminase-like domain-containing protein [Acidimicrobiales bacterium]